MVPKKFESDEAEEAEDKEDGAEQEEETTSDVEYPPLSDYYKLTRFETVSKSRNWWTTIMVIELPGGHERLSIYRYKHDSQSGLWRKKSAFNINSREDLDRILTLVGDLKETVKFRVRKKKDSS